MNGNSKTKISQKLVQSENKKLYAFEASTYDVAHPEVWNWYEQKRINRLLEKTFEKIVLPNPKIIDIGAGTGNLSLKYLKKGAEVISVDISNEMLLALKAKVPIGCEDQITLLNRSAEDALDSIDAFDGICFSSVLHHIYDYEAFVEKAIEKLKPGGFFLNVHDPLIQKPGSKWKYKLHRYLALIDESVYRARMRNKDIRIDEFPDDSIAEFHQTSGLFNHDRLIKKLNECGLSIEHFEKYVSRRYGFSSWLSTEIIGSENCFALIGRKS